MEQTLPEISVPLPELTNGEREMLRVFFAPAAPGGKVLQKMLDYGEHLKQSLVGVDLMDPVSVNAARKLQSTIIAITWTQETFAQAMVDQPTEAKSERTAGHE